MHLPIMKKLRIENEQAKNVENELVKLQRVHFDKTTMNLIYVTTPSGPIYKRQLIFQIH